MQLQSNEGYSSDPTAEALLRERVLAKEQELDGKIHLKLVTSPTEKAYGRLEKCWRK